MTTTRQRLPDRRHSETFELMSTAAPSSAFTSFMLGRLRFAHAQARLVCNQIATVSAALRGGHIGPETALVHLHECGLVDFVTGASS